MTINTLPGVIGQKVMKKWEEMMDSEKLETLRDEMRNSRYLISRIVKLEQQMREVMTHEHGTDGKPVVPFKENYNGDSASMTYDRLA